MSLQNTFEKVQSKSCTIEIFGLGYVGFPLSMRLASSGYKVVGVDNDPKKINRLQNKSLMESEQILEKVFLESIKNGNFVPSNSPTKSSNSKIGIICVPTPIPEQNVLSNVFVKSAVENFLGISKQGDVLIIESSIEIGTTEEIKKVIESRGFKVGIDFGLCFCPERIDPLNQKWKLENIPRVIFCSDDKTFEIAQKIYQNVNNSNLVRVNSPKTAEVVKSFENAFRLVNISLVNELALLCDKLKINVKDVIDAAATKPFGFMPFYPSAGAGGHCIPKDPRFLSLSAKKFGFEFTTIDESLKINSFIPIYITNTIERILDELRLEKSVLVCGLTYKPDIEDMRDSPGFKILNEMNLKKFRVVAYDPYYKKEIHNKYLRENNIAELNFEILPDLNDLSMRGFNCICVVQHHAKTKFRLLEIYKNSLTPFIYDCQNQICKEPRSRTLLKSLGG